MSFRPSAGDGGGVAAENATMLVATRTDEFRRTLGILELVLAACGLLVLGATALVVPRVLRLGLAPLRQLAEHASRNNKIRSWGAILTFWN